MSFTFRVSGVLLLLSGLAVARADEPSRLPDVTALQAAMQKAIERAEPSIACILVTRAEGGGGFAPEKPNFVPELYGSGVVIDETGLVLTNEHVVRGATGLFVRVPDEKGCVASILAADQRSDLAVLKLNVRGRQFKAIQLGQGEKLHKGQFVLSLANPFAAGFRDGSPSASWGIVSNLRRRGPLSEMELKGELQNDKSLNQLGTLVQTDARLNLGCSGGALIDLDGKLVGLTTALAALNGSETPGGFALPMGKNVRRIVEKLRRGEEVEYGFLGVWFSQNPPAGLGGAAIDRSIPGAPAAAAGLPTNGCVIVSLDDVPVRDQAELSYLVSTTLAGNTVKVGWRSTGGVSSARVKLAKMYMPTDRFVATNRSPMVGGLRVDHTSTLARGVPIPFHDAGIPSGVVIREVQPKSSADKAQLYVDKVITRVNDQLVYSPADFYLAVDAATGGSVELTILGRAEKVRLDLR
jgi:S1-C subfamily serine protease